MSTDHGSPPVPAEPKTPAWFTALGAVLFLAVAAWWLASQPPSLSSASSAPSDAGAPPSAAVGTAAH
jgi:hypothetical protein